MMMMTVRRVSMMRMMRMVLQMQNEDDGDVGMHEADSRDYDHDQCR